MRLASCVKGKVMSVPTVTPPATSADETARNSLVIRLLIVAAFTVILNETIMGVAIPHLMEDLGITAVAAQWLTTAFLLTMAVVIPITGFLLQRLTTRAVFITAMSLFAAGTLLGALAPGFSVLVLARVVQASGTAIMLPLLMTTVMNLVPAAERGRRMGNITIVIAVAPAIGPAISGAILSVLGWRYLFLFVLPVALAVLALGYARMVNVGEVVRSRLDIPSIPLAAMGFGGVVFGLSRFGEAPENRNLTAIGVTLALGVLALGVFVWRQLHLQRADRALLDLRTFRTPAFTLSVLMFVVSMMGLFGTIILLPLYTQNVLGMSVLATGLLLLPGGLTLGLLGPVVGRAYDRVGPRPLLVPGSILVAASMWALALATGESTPWVVLLGCHIVFSAGLCMLFTPLFTSSLGSLPRHLYSHGSATLSTMQQVGGAAGTAAFVSVMAAVAASRIAGGASEIAGTAAGVRSAFFLSAVISTIAIAIAFFVPKPSEPLDSVAGTH
jgi:DHA2 family lincomycin resistance protein-like MFS transporter